MSENRKPIKPFIHLENANVDLDPHEVVHTTQPFIYFQDTSRDKATVFYGPNPYEVALKSYQQAIDTNYQIKKSTGIEIGEFEKINFNESLKMILAQELQLILKENFFTIFRNGTGALICPYLMVDKNTMDSVLPSPQFISPTIYDLFEYNGMSINSVEQIGIKVGLTSTNLAAYVSHAYSSFIGEILGTHGSYFDIDKFCIDIMSLNNIDPAAIPKSSYISYTIGILNEQAANDVAKFRELSKYITYNILYQYLLNSYKIECKTQPKSFSFADDNDTKALN